MELLVSVIFHAAVTILDNDRVFQLLGREKREALQQFQAQVEMALSNSDVMFNPCFRSLQGLTIYLVTSPSNDCHGSNVQKKHRVLFARWPYLRRLDYDQSCDSGCTFHLSLPRWKRIMIVDFQSEMCDDAGGIS